MQRILVTGATGYLGRRLVPLLQKNNFSVRCLIRSKKDIPRCEISVGDITHKDSLKEAVKDVDMVIHLAAVTHSSNPDIDAVNVLGTKNLVEVCEHNIKKFIYISSAAAIHPQDAYGISKQKAEAIVRNSQLAYIILRPTLTYSYESDYFSKILGMIKKIPGILPVIGNGRYKINPVHAEDVTSAILAVIQNDIAYKTYDLGGPRPLEFNEFLSIITQSLKLKRVKIHIPAVLCESIAQVFELSKKPLITRPMIKALMQNTLQDITPAKKDFNYDPLDFKKAMELMPKSL